MLEKMEDIEIDEDVKINEATSKMLQVLDWSYEMAINGLPAMGSAIDLAQDYEKEDGTLEDKVNTLIRWQISKATTTGFITGLGGIITLPVAIPADIASAVYIQMRMIAAIAYMGGYDIKNDKVKTLVYVCLIGDSAKNILIDVGKQIGLKIGQNLLKKLPGKILVKINQKVGFRLVTKFGTKGAINLVKVIPVIGGIVGGSVNAIMTNSIGNVARETFIKSSYREPLADQFIELMNVSSDIPNIEILKLYSYLNIIKVDGCIKNEEYELFDILIKNSLLDDKIKMELIQKLNSKEIDVIDYSQFLSYPEQSLELLKNLILIAKCDRDFHITEKMFIKNVGKQIGYSEVEIEKLISE